MSYGPEALLIIVVATVGVLHTIVPDHWLPIALIARQRNWTKAETARASLQAGVGHVLSTLLIAFAVWLAGVAFARHFGKIADDLSSIALIAFGAWIGVMAWRDLHIHGGHGHTHRGHGHEPRKTSTHGPDLQRVTTENGVIELSIFEDGVPPRFRLTGPVLSPITVQTLREGGERENFLFENHGVYWESVDEISEPHEFAVSLIIDHGGHTHRYDTRFTEHGHSHGGFAHEHENTMALVKDPLYMRLRSETAVITQHVHAHRHGRELAHTHWHDHALDSSHVITSAVAASPPFHYHNHKTASRTALLLILGSSPMVEGIPAFFAASRYGVGLIAVMSIVFAISTIATYVLLCVYSSTALRRVKLGPIEQYGEVLSGAFIAIVGLIFWSWQG